MKVEARLAEGAETTAVCLQTVSVFFFSRSFFPRSSRVHSREGGRREEEPKRDDHAHTVRAFDFSRRNDYAIISRRVPFLLKRKTSSPSPSSPWRLSLCNVSGGETASLSLITRANRAPFLPLSLIQSTLHPFVTIRADVPIQCG